jgi:hypothetical protein
MYDMYVRTYVCSVLSSAYTYSSRQLLVLFIVQLREDSPGGPVETKDAR